MKTLSYFRGREEQIVVGGTYYLGQLHDGNINIFDILLSGCIAIDENIIVTFEVISQEKKLDNDKLVKIIDIY